MTVTQPQSPRFFGGERRPSHTVLVVDDEPDVRHMAARILIAEGYAVHEAGDGREALEFLERGDVPIDVMVSDIVMPLLNGVELTQKLSVSHPSLPVILMSGYGFDDLAARGITSPCAVLVKPFSADRLIAEVRRCITQRP